MRLELQGDEDRGVVGRVAEIAQATRVAGQCRETVVDELCGTYSLEERTGHVNEIDPLAGERTLLEITRMQTIHDVDVRSMFPHIVMHQESLVILGQAINLIVHTRACIEITQHHPILGSGLWNRADCLFTDILHLLRTEHVTLLILDAFRLVHSLVRIFLRPSMQRDDVHRLATDFHLRPAGTMHYHDIVSIAIYPLDNPERILGSDHLRESITLSADEHILMSIPPCQEIPVPRKVEFVILGHLHIGVCTIT